MKTVGVENGTKFTVKSNKKKRVSIVTRPSYLSFTLPDSFVETYKDKRPPFGFTDAAGTSLGEITFARTYSHKKDDGTKEQWYEVVRRVVEGTYSLQKDYCLANRLPWNGQKALASAKNMFDKFFYLKSTPPGRGLSQMGRELVNKHKISSPLQNCSNISTNEMTKYDPAKPFVFMLQASSLGIGVGFDVRGADKNFKIHKPNTSTTETFVIPDSREGWAEALRLRINSYLIEGKSAVEFDYSGVRPAGSEIKTFGGTASGPEPLREVLDGIAKIFDTTESETVTVRHIADIMNMIGKCIVAGGARRSAQLMMGSIEDEGYLDFKNYEANPERASYGWASNNSVDVSVGDDLTPIIEGIARNGEPGVLWMDTTRKYGRLKDAPDNKDWRVSGYNPCCLVGNTRVLTVNGEVSLSEITEPTLIEDPDTGIWHSSTSAWSNGVKPTYTLKTENGLSITGTADHKLRSAGTWIDISNFVPGDAIDVDRHHNEDTVTSVEYAGDQEVFDITVDDIHMFSANGIVAHNCEQPLESMEMCTLSCVFLNNATSKEDFLETLKYAYLYAKTVTLLPTQWDETNSVMQRNRRIGVSLGGIADFVDNFGLPTLREWMDEGYEELRRLDKTYSEWLCVRESIRISTVKPDGSVGLLAGTSPGVHWTPGGKFFIRRITLQNTDPLVAQFKRAGYNVVTSYYSPESAVVVELPIKSDAKRSEAEVSIFEKANLAAELQYYWSDNAVSVTVSFDPEKEFEDVGKILHMYEGKLKTVSFLPMGGKYEQMPYEPITEDQYEEMRANLDTVDLSPIYGLEAEEVEDEKFCTTDACLLPEAPGEPLEEEVV